MKNARIPAQQKLSPKWINILHMNAVVKAEVSFFFMQDNN